ncbi:MAG: HD-GYP domain-containing protein [Pseudomonadota bacterium]|nr:HD-GYP domain-containing protein [Pseudomonadota bacterium]
MLKLIKVKDLRSGMFVKEVVGSWLDHPFWRSSFQVTGPDTIARLRESGIQELWIDTDRGVDVLRKIEKEVSDASQRAVAASAAADPAVADAGAAPAGSASAAPPPVVQRVLRPADEAGQAILIRDKGKRVVSRIIREARLGKLNTDEAMSLVEEISESVMRSPDAFITVARIKNKDEYTYLHSVAVCALMVALARQLQFPPDVVRIAGLAGLMHDVGKVAIPEDVLNKPGTLTDEEFRIIKAHPVVGAELLRSDGKVPEEVIDVCLRHHERIDGLGYPGGLKSAEISMLARMGAVCDVYDAVTSDRPYKRGWSPAESIKRMAAWTNTHFDDRIFKAFVKCIGIYPVGSLVRLSSERLAVITRQEEESLLTPEVKVFYSIRSASRIVPETVDLARSRDRILSAESPEGWGLSNIEYLWSEP